MISAFVIGLGNIGLKYDLEGPGDTIMTHTMACCKHPAVNLVGGADPDLRARLSFERAADRPAFVSLAESMVIPGQVDLFIVSTPTEIRLPIVRECIGLRPKAILLEKPLADNVEEGAAIVRACAEAEVLLAVNYFRRFDRVMAGVGDDIRSGKFGPLRFATCLYSGGLLANGSHYVDLFLDWFGKPTQAKPIILADGPRKGAKLFELDYGDFYIIFQKIEADYGIGEIDLLFEKGRVLLKNYGESIERMASRRDPVFREYRRLTPDDSDHGQPDMLRYQYNVLDHLVSAILHGTPVPSSGETALSVLEICMDVLRDG